MPEKNYPNSDVLERAYLVWMFHNKELRAIYLQKTLPAMFLHPSRRLLIYLMQRMEEHGMEITAPNIALYLQNNINDLKPFIRKHRVKILTESEIQDILYDMEITSNTDLFDKAKELLLVYAFARFVDDRMKDINYYNSYAGTYESSILAASKGILKVYDMLHGRLEIKRDQLNETKDLINSGDEYISTSSQGLNSYLGGWTKGYVATLIAKSGHTKSSWIDYDTCHSIFNKKVKSAVIISPEEIAPTRWRRIIAMVLKIPTSHMRQKLVEITGEQIDRVRDIMQDRLAIYDQATKYKDILDLMASVKTDKLVVDHLQSIEYPGNKDYLSNMIGNIPGIIDFQKRLAKARKMVVINLSQVGDKEIKRSDRLSKAPRYYDAYGSSVLYQASREFLALYYPIKDYEDNPISFGAHPPTVNDVTISIEKSSFSTLGKVKLDFNPEFNTFKDKPAKIKGDYIAPAEKSVDEGLFQ